MQILRLPGFTLRRMILSTAFMLVAAAPGAAQTVVGTITEEATGTPLAGAFVTLLTDGTGDRAAAVLTDAVGRYAMHAPGPGRYRLRVERIGFETVESEPFELAAERSVRRSFAVPTMAIELEGIEAEGEARCRVRPAEGLAVARVWDEARKALSLARWTGETQALRFRVERYSREVDPEAMRVIEESRQSRTAHYRSSPFTSIPADTLIEKGFIRERAGGGYTFHAPDANVLLSDAFLDTHCFRLRSDDGRAEGDVRLAFEPVGDRGVADIRGTIRLDPETAELRALEYGYAELPWQLGRAADEIGGRVEFEHLTTGEWIVRRWRIRMPEVALRRQTFGGQSREVPVVLRIREQGGEVREVRTPGGRVLASGTRATVAGIVWDSMRAAPLAGAIVYLSGTSIQDTTDAGGRFHMAGVPAGSYTIGFIHPRVDSLGITPSTRTVDVARGATVDTRLALPSTRVALERDCLDVGAAERGIGSDPTMAGVHEGTAVLVGAVRPYDRSGDGRDLRVMLAWDAWSVRLETDRGRVRREGRTVEVTPNARGGFRVCRLPENVTIRVWTRRGEATSETREVRLTPDEIRRIDLAAPSGG